MTEIVSNEVNKKFYQINWIKQIAEKSEKISLIIDWESEEEIRNIANKNLKIIILWMSIYNWKIEDFWKILFKVSIENKEYTWVINSKNLVEWFNYISKTLWVVPSYINDNEKKLSDEKISQVIDELMRRDQAEKDKQKQETEKRKAKKKIDEPAMQELKLLINDSITEAEELSERIAWIVTTSEMKIFKDTINDIKKLRMSRNTENLIELLENLMEMSEKFEDSYTEYMKNKEIQETADSVVTQLDIIWEYKKFKKSEKVTKVSKIWKVQKSMDDVYYSSFGKKWIYYRLIWKEIKSRILKLDNFLSWVFRYAEIFIIFVLLDLTIYIIYPYFLKAIWSWTWELEKMAVYYYIWNFWLLWTILYWLKYFIKQNLTIIIVLYSIGILLFILLNRFIVYNFAF